LDTAPELAGQKETFRQGVVQEIDLKTACTQSATGYDRDSASDRISTALRINARKMGSSLSMVDDDVQNALEKLLAACESILSGRYDGRIQGFVLAVLKHRRIDTFRREKISTVPLDDFEMQPITPRQLQFDSQPDLDGRDLITRLTTRLTERQRDVLMGLGSGLNRAETAKELGRDTKTVEDHLKRIRKKYSDLVESPNQASGPRVPCRFDTSGSSWKSLARGRVAMDDPDCHP
jgi:DNA-directed RNA polymerase specialized sigma24 family protein